MISGITSFNMWKIVWKILERNDNNIKYVYKNGDSGDKYLSIVYQTGFKIEIFILSRLYCCYE